MIPRKKNNHKIIERLNELRYAYRGTFRSWWPDYVFHFTEIRNAVQILEDERLYSRNQIEARKLTYFDAASPSIISHSSEHVKDYVRFYFRPKTPTQYRMEGIRPDSKRWIDSDGNPAHCPVPIFFLFDAPALLAREDCEYTDGNFASDTATKGNTAEFFCNLPFSQIYHTGAYDKTDPANWQISHRRCAEVLIPNELDLTHLRAIACRSVAEKETLLSLLPSRLHKKFELLIRVPNYPLFFKEWTHVENVRMTPTQIRIQFSPDSTTAGPFVAVAEITDLSTGDIVLDKIVRGYNANVLALITLPSSLLYYDFKLTLDSNIAYQNTYFPF